MAGDERAVSESTSVVILVSFTVVVTATVGISVLFVGDRGSGEPTATFAFEHNSDSQTLLVTHDGGDSVPAGQLVVESGTNSATWAEVADSPPNETVEPDSAIQLGANSAWGQSVQTGTPVEIYHDPGDGNRTMLDAWED